MKLMKRLCGSSLVAFALTTSVSLTNGTQSSIHVSAASQTALTSAYDVKTFGAKGDGTTIDSPAINKAIETAVAAGGGTQ